MNDNDTRSNAFPIVFQGLFLLGCMLLPSENHLYINFLFYMVLVIYFYRRNDFSVREWLHAVKSGTLFWRQVMWTALCFGFAFFLTNALENMFPQYNTGMIRLRADNWGKLVLFAATTVVLPPVAEEVFYRQNLISFRNKKVLIGTVLWSMALYALEHATALWGILLCMIWALPLSVSYIKTKNVYVPMTAHIICNIMINGMTVVAIAQTLLR